LVTVIRDKIYFLPNYTIEKALKLFPELKKSRNVLLESQGQAISIDL